MIGVVPAAGEGTRLRPLTAEKPKALVEAAGRPLLSHCFETLRNAGVTEFVVVVGYEGQQIVDRYGAAYDGTPITYVRQDEQLGLGHAVLQARPHVSESFVVLNGDNVFAGDVNPVTSLLDESGVDTVMLVERASREEARTTGVVETDADERVTGLVEKPEDPPSTLISAGCWALPPEIFHALELIQPSDRGEYELTDALELLVDAGFGVKAVELTDERVNVNTEADLTSAEKLVTGSSTETESE